MHFARTFYIFRREVVVSILQWQMELGLETSRAERHRNGAAWTAICTTNSATTLAQSSKATKARRIMMKNKTEKKR